MNHLMKNKNLLKDSGLKDKWLKVGLIALPVLAFGLATTGDSVRVFNNVTKEMSYGSYFALMDIGSLAILPPVAGICTLVSFVLGVVYLVKKKESCLNYIRLACLIGGVCAGIPVLFRGGELLVLPNVGVPLFALCNLTDAHMLLKKQVQPESGDRTDTLRHKAKSAGKKRKK